MENKPGLSGITNSLPLKRVASISFWENTVHVDLCATEKGPAVRLTCGLVGLPIHLSVGSARVLARALNTAALLLEKGSYP